MENLTNKMADILDAVDTNLGDLIDKHIESILDEEKKLPDFPEFGAIIKEEMVESNSK